MHRTSTEVCRAEGISYYRLTTLIRSGKLRPPQKDGSGNYAWMPADVERLRRALAGQAESDMGSIPVGA